MHDVDNRAAFTPLIELTGDTLRLAAAIGRGADGSPTSSNSNPPPFPTYATVPATKTHNAEAISGNAPTSRGATARWRG